MVGAPSNSKRYVSLIAGVAMIFAITSILTRGLIVLPELLLVHPETALPLSLTLLLGPAAAWGSALGVLIRDLVSGSLGLVSLFESAAMFLLGYLGYYYWNEYGPASAGGATALWRTIPRLILVIVVSSIGAAAFLSWGKELLAAAPFFVTALETTPDYVLMTLTIGLPLVLVSTKVFGAEDRLIGIAQKQRPQGRPDHWSPSKHLSLVVPIAWLLLGTIGAIGYRLLEMISPQQFYERGLGFLLIGYQRDLFGPGAVNVQAVFGSLMVVVFVLIAVSRRDREHGGMRK